MTKETEGDGSKTAKPFHEGEEGAGKASPGMKEAPRNRADAFDNTDRKKEKPKTTQRQE